MYRLVLQLAVSYVIALFDPGTTTPTTAPLAVLGTVPDSAIVCNLPPGTDAGPIVLGATLAGVTWTDPVLPGRRCQAPPLAIPPGVVPLCLAAPCPEYALLVGSWGKAAAQIVTVPVFTVPPACLPPLGNRAVAVFPTGVQQTTGLPGSRARANYQLASPNSPIVTIRFRLDGVIAAELSGDQLLDTAGIWFQVPPTGEHRTSLEAVNQAGCAREVAGPGLTVP